MKFDTMHTTLRRLNNYRINEQDIQRIVFPYSNTNMTNHIFQNLVGLTYIDLQ